MPEPQEQLSSNADKPSRGYQTQSRDTSEWAERLFFEHLGTLDPRASMRMCMEACRTMDEFLFAGLRRDFPQADDEELEFRAAVAKYGADCMETFTGHRLPGT